MNREIISGLKKVPFLSELQEPVLQTLAEKTKAARFPKNAIVIMEGDTSDSLYIILEGKVRVFTKDEKNKEITLILQEPGSYFGEIALLSDEPRSASVATLEPTLCAVISKAEFLELLMENPHACIVLMGVLTDKIRKLTQKVKKFALSNVYERTIQTLLELAVDEGGYKMIYDRPSQQDLAAMVGASREMINKVMQELTKGGYLEIRDKIMIINKKFPDSW